MGLKVSGRPADGLLMVVLQPLVIALNIVLLMWAFRVLDDLERDEVPFGEH
jgi:hypothetical protein